MSLEISRIQAIPVNIPYRTSPIMSAGASANSTRTIVVVETKEGVTGLGEASYATPAALIERDFAPELVGLDALNHALLRSHCLPNNFDYGTPALKARLAAWGGIEIALWDILGKYARLPLYRLLGGTCRRQAPFVAYAYADSDSDNAASSMALRAKQAVDATGASIFEFKVGVHPVEVEIEIVRSVAEALKGRAAIAIDANMGMSIDTARRLLLEVAPYLENFEEPVPGLADMALLSREFRVNVSTHCSDLEAVLHYPDIRGIVPTLDVCGGIEGARRLADALSAVGRRVWLRSHAESGIGWAAMVHLGMSFRNLGRPGQSLIDMLEDDLILGDRWLVRGGGVRPPEHPGLGVELDWEAVRRYNALYLKVGEIQAFPPNPI